MSDNTILIVDDALFMRQRCRKLLEKNGYHVEEAENGAKAIFKYRQVNPDVVLLDITMPVMDGITCVQKLMQIDPAAKIIMVSAMGQQGMVTQAIVSGARDFILKPFDPDRILETLNKVLNEKPPSPEGETPGEEALQEDSSWDRDDYSWLEQGEG
ncbi:MAG: response regulator [Armatimonadetes bacterium]|nr:response regulator [Armatimonadota bacterium]